MHRPKISTVCNPKPVDTLRPDSRPGIKTARTNRSQFGRKTSLCCGINECLILAKAHTILPHSCMVCIVSRLDRFLRRLRHGSGSSYPCVTNSATYIRMQLAIALTSPCYKIHAVGTDGIVFRTFAHPPLTIRLRALRRFNSPRRAFLGTTIL